MKRTRAFIVGVVLLIGVYDLAALWIWGAQATISRVFLDDVTIAPSIAFALGYVCGHLTWSQRAR